MVTAQYLSVSSEDTDAPLLMNAPDCSSIALSGRSMPSKMLSMMPGPSRTFIGAPVPVTGSPGLRPVVSSYTWIVVSLSVMPMTSPTRFCSPT